MKYVHFRNGQRGGATVSFEVEEKKIKIGVAFCSIKDQFSRSLGRKISSGRLMNDKTPYRFEIDLPIDATKDNIINHVRNEVISRYPTRLNYLITY